MLGMGQSKQADQGAALPRGVVRRWRCRRACLETELEKHPDSEWAWLWRARVRVLEYLIDRYKDGAAELGPIPRRTRSALGRSSPGPSGFVESTSPYDTTPQRPTLPAAQPGGGVSEQQRRLASLHNTNEARRAMTPVIPPTPPPRVGAAFPIEPIRWLLKRYHNELAGQQRRGRLGEQQAQEAAEALYQLLNEAGDGISRLTYPDDMPEHTRGRSLRQLADELALADNEQNGMGLMRRLIAFEIGLDERPVEALDERSLRAILAEHGIEPDEI